MPSLSTESTPRERVERILALLGRTRLFWRSSLAIAVAGLIVAGVVAMGSKRAWRSETTVLYRNAIQTRAGEADASAARAARLGPKLKDLLYARPKLEQVIREHNLFPEKQKKSMLEAVEEMGTAVGFRVRGGDSFAISFTYEDPVVAQEVTARLTDLMIQEYNRQNIDTATLTRDFLQRELEEASARVDESSRALATFLADNPAFQWGVGDSPYAPTPGAQGAPPGIPYLPRAAPRGPPGDGTLTYLQHELARVEASLGAPASAPAPAPAAPLPPAVADAQKQRDAAAAAVGAAQAALSERLAVVTPAHPDAISAQARLLAARQSLAAAEAALQKARAAAGPGDPPPEPPADPGKRAELEQRRDKLRQQIAERRRRLAEAGPAPARTADPAPSAGAADKAAPGKAPTVIDLETEWHRLRLDLEHARDQLRVVQTNAHAADISADAVEKQSQEEMQILEPAYRPTRPDRGRGRVFLVGALIALMLACGYASARVFLNDTLLDESDVLAIGAPPVLVMFPVIADPPKPSERAMVPSIGVDPDRGPYAPPRPAAGRPADLDAVIVPGPAAPPPQLAPAAPDPEPGARRDGAVTIRFGFPLPPPTPPSPPVSPSPSPSPSVSPSPSPSVSPSVSASPSPSPSSSLVLRDPVALAEAIFAGHDAEPEVEVIGADVDAEGEGAFALLRGAPPAALASLRVLRHRLEQKRGGDGSFVVSVVSPGADEGKTLLAVQLAMTLSEADRARVVLVEGHLARPRVAATLGLRLPDHAGFSAQIRRHMNGRVRPWGVVRLGPSLTVMAEPGREAAYPAALHSTHFEIALEALRRAYDYVVIDGPAVLGSGDANVLEGVSSGVIMVARASFTRGSALTRAVAQLGDRRILGVVLSGVAEPETERAPKAAESAA
jgi:Mrp family chromosome partitioning ATPase